ncbi:amino acid permease [Patescibacteria group bacterium]|nr:amino acid permease [Patescibacteria group bacterium]
MNKRFFQALAILMGHIIGVGIFSLPFIASRVGIWTMLFYFLILGGITILFELLYGEVILRTREKHRLPGYAKKYLGGWAKNLALFSSGLGLIIAVLAYIIVGGGFLGSILVPILGGNSTLYVYTFFVLGAFLIFFGVKSIARVESVMLVFFLIILGLIFYKGASVINPVHLFVFDSKYLFLPYGAILFSLAGFSVIPEIREYLIEKPKNLRKVIILATSLAALISLFFVFIILGITGSETTPEAIAGLKNHLSNGIVVLVLLFGVLATFTSFLTCGLTLKKILWYDFKINKHISWALACFLPIFLFILGLTDFIKIISISGGVLLAISAILMIFIYLKAKTKGDLEPAYSLNLPKILVYSLIIFFVIGAAYELIYFFL